MFTLVYGGASSGKSEYAEKHVCRLNGERVYIATMKPWDQECRNRIEKHQKARAHRQFTTRECFENIGKMNASSEENMLLEDLPNLTANELYGESHRSQEEILEGILLLSNKCAHLTIVSGDVFSGGQDYEGDTLNYLKVLAYLNREIAKRADFVVEIQCGIANVLKGGSHASI